MDHPHNDQVTRDATAPGEQADTSTPPRRRRSLAIAASAAAVLTLLAAVAAGRPGSQAATQPNTPNRGATPTAVSGRNWPSAASTDPKAMLERFADDLTNAPADPARARFEYIDVRTWDSFAAPPAAAPSGPPPPRRIQLWTTGKGASRAVELDESHGCQLVSDQTGDDLGLFDGPLSSDPDAVRRQVLHEPLPSGVVPDVFGQVAGIYSARFLPLATRQGVLRMLARLPGVGVQPQITDRAGRSGFAVTWIYAPPMPFTVAKTLIFDPGTGQLLASHSQAHRRTDATTPPDQGDHYAIYVLILTSTYAPDTHTPELGCPR
ncbi:hypothetical protein [Dactylosporangium sp. NPDC048998]|uniref:hypothetical protein n=1 Tax=Dactylosporangium sp. NPDC048998 TaxID=3363976 RepID=UPI003722CCFE